MIADEEHESTHSESVHTTLEIVLSEMNYEEFRCEFVLRDYSICSKTTRVQKSCEILFKCRSHIADKPIHPESVSCIFSPRRPMVFPNSQSREISVKTVFSENHTSLTGECSPQCLCNQMTSTRHIVILKLLIVFEVYCLTINNNSNHISHKQFMKMGTLGMKIWGVFLKIWTVYKLCSCDRLQIPRNMTIIH